MTVPTVAVKGLGSHYDRFNGLFVTAQAVGLNNFLAPIACPNRNRNIAGCESVHVLCTLSAFFKVVGYCILVRQVTVYTFRDLFMRGVIPILVLCIHLMAIGTSFGSASA